MMKIVPLLGLLVMIAALVGLYASGSLFSLKQVVESRS
jgi:hypothetical protein